MIWMIPLIGAAAGALLDKKQPLRGAALGAAAGFTGGAALGAMGAAGAGSAAAGSSSLMSGAGGLLGSGGAAGGGFGGMLGSAAPGAAAAAPNAAASSGLLGSMGSMVKPVGTAMQTAQMFQSKDEPPPATPAMIQPPMGGAQSLTQLAQGNQVMAQQQQQITDARRDAQKQRIARMGGLLYG